jgi:hypothetical protein
LRSQTLRWIVIIICFVTVSLSCQLLSSDNVDKSPGEVLFKDDFSDPASGWNRVSAENGETDYDDGVYRIFVNEPDTDIWSKPGLNLGDVIIEVDAFKVGGERDNRFGVICRHVDTSNFYTFIISSDGFYGIGKVKDDIYELIDAEALLPNEIIQQGSALNHMRAECVGDLLTLHINGQKIAQVLDTDYQTGDVGLLAGTYNIPGTDIRFDNFMVYRP